MLIQKILWKNILVLFKLSLPKFSSSKFFLLEFSSSEFFIKISSSESEEISILSIMHLEVFFSLTTYLHSSKRAWGQ